MDANSSPMDWMAMAIQMERLSPDHSLPLSGFIRTSSSQAHTTTSHSPSSHQHFAAGLPTPPHSPVPVAAMREMIFRIAAMQPVHIDPESVKPPKRRNVRISKDPQSVAARHRRERISERIRILQRLVPGGTKMDTASMLDEAIHYVKFLKSQVQSLERASAGTERGASCFDFSPAAPSGENYCYFDVASHDHGEQGLGEADVLRY